MAKLKTQTAVDGESREVFVSRVADRVQQVPPTDPPLPPGVFPREVAVRIAESVWRAKRRWSDG